MRSSIFISVFFVLASCATKVVGIYNPGSLDTVPKSFHVYYPDDEDSFSPERQQLDQQLVEIITKGLEARSLSESSLPDLYVSFIISVHATEEINQNNLSAYDMRYRYRNFGYYDPMAFDSRSYKEGVLIIDLRNSDNKLVWQGSKSFKLSARRSSSDELLESCREIIASFDPQQVN